MKDQVILRVVAKLMLPYILLYAFYVQWHGDFGPGGGFQAGVIFAAAFILYALVYGMGNAIKALPPKAAYICGGLGVMIYAGVGYVTLALGGNFLGYNVLAHDPTHGQHYGIMAVELGVLITVFGAMLAIFYAFAGRRRVDR